MARGQGSRWGVWGPAGGAGSVWYLPEATSTRDTRRPVGSSLTRRMPLSSVTDPSVLVGGVLKLSLGGPSQPPLLTPL